MASMLSRLSFAANVVDILGRRIRASEIVVAGGRIESITALADGIDATLPYALPGFIDAHVHVESSMLVPSEFARMAVVHGTVATVSDPHEIANVLGVRGVEFMIANARHVPLKICFGAPSCVPATAYETAGDCIDAVSVRQLLDRTEIGYLAEMMNYPGVLGDDPEVHAKIAAAKAVGKPVDGHAPGLRGEQAARYIAAGISTDHECTTLDEALDKLAHGMSILIREGSAAKNFAALFPLIDSHCDRVMFCSDDKHPDELAVGHINLLVRRAIAGGADLFNVLRVACINPIEHYSLDVGRLAVGDPADLILVDDLRSFGVREVFIAGQCVARGGQTQIQSVAVTPINRFDCDPKVPADFRIQSESTSATTTVRVIHAFGGSLVTHSLTATVAVRDQRIESDPWQDVLKIAVVNRYGKSRPAVALVRGFGLRCGAIASSVSHDSHNILAVGVSDEEICAAVNLVIAHCGAVAAVNRRDSRVLPLPIAGIMSDRDGVWVAEEYKRIDDFAKQSLGSSLAAPFMTLSFMALLVIPELKLSDRGLFDSSRFEFVPMAVFHDTY